MPEDLYESAPPSQPEASEKGADQMREDQDNQKTAVVPREIFGGKTPKVGDVCEFRVEQVMDDEIALSYVSSNDESESENNAPEESDESEAPAPPPDEGGMYS